MKIEDATPRKGMIGNLPMFNGTRKALFMLGMVYLNQIKDRLTVMNVMNAARLVNSATIFMSPKKMKIIESIMMTKTASQGVLVLV